MPISFAHLLGAAVLCGAALSLVSPVRAQKPPAQTVRQVDGITERVLDGLWEKADGFWHEGDYNRIVSIARVVVEGDPSFNEAYATSAWLLWSQGDLQAADRLFQQGISQTQNKGDLCYEFGVHYFNTKRYDQAEKYFRQGVNYGKVPVLCYTMLGHSLTKQKKYKEAVQVWRTVVKKYPDFNSGPTNLKKAEQLARGASS